MKLIETTTLSGVWKRRANAHNRLVKQLERGQKNVKGGLFVLLTDGEKTRIKKEIETLKTKF